MRTKQLHGLRIQCKRYRYLVATLQDLGVNITKQDLRFAKAAKSVHGTLGDLRETTAPAGTPPGYLKSKRRLLQRAENLLQRRP